MQNNIFSGDSADHDIIIVDETTSTNDYLKAMASNFTPCDNFTAIMAKRQTKGRGQRDNSFYSSEGESLTFSFILFPKQLPVADVFAIQTLISLSLHDWLSQYTDQCRIKWPNDMMLGNKKGCGVLIENALAGSNVKHSIIGIGINIAQTTFPNDIAHRATSLKMHNPNFVEKPGLELCKELLACIKHRYESDWNQPENLLAGYNQLLYRLDEEALYQVGEEIFTGIIRSVDSAGMLHLEQNGRLQAYRFKEVSMIP